MLFLFFTMMAQAAELKCIAPFDDGSYYQLLAKVEDKKIVGTVGFSYVTTDGMDLKAKLKVSKQTIAPGEKIHLEGTNGNLAVEADADYWAEDKNYQGAIKVSFALDGAPPVEAVMTCVLN